MAGLSVVTSNGKALFDFGVKNYSTMILSPVQPGSAAYTSVDASKIEVDEVLATLSVSAKDASTGSDITLCAAFDPSGSGGEDLGQLVLDKCEEVGGQRSAIFVWQTSTFRLRPTWFSGHDDGQSDYGSYVKVGPESWTVPGYPSVPASVPSAPSATSEMPVQATDTKVEAGAVSVPADSKTLVTSSISVINAENFPTPTSPSIASTVFMVYVATADVLPGFSLSSTSISAAGVQATTTPASQPTTTSNIPAYFYATAATSDSSSPSASPVLDASSAVMTPVTLRPYDWRFVVINAGGQPATPAIAMESTS
jgi:hypothetical protein